MPDQRYLVVGTPCYGRQVTDLYAASILKLLLACQQRDIRFAVQMSGSDALITRARQNIVGNFLANQEATHLLFIDSDIGFEPDQAFRLLDFGAPVSAAIYPLKKLDWRKVASSAAGFRSPLESASLTYTVGFREGRPDVQRDGFARVQFAATGFMLLQRDALISMIEHYPELRYKYDHRPGDTQAESPWRSALFNCMIDETGAYLSEDYSFCRRWTEMGGEIWIDLKSKLVHVGTMEFRGDFTTQVLAK